MSRIEEMIEEMCPDGVEYRRLGDVTVMKRGTSLTKKKAEEGSIPVISGGRQPAFYCSQSNREGETITVAGSGAGAGFVQYWNEPIFACDCFTVEGTEALDTRYVYHWMTSMQNAIYSCKKGGGVPHVHISDIDSFEIPVPPLQVQEEIVRTLDAFTKLATELTTELAMRTKQYAYYRGELMKLEGVEGVEYRKIDDVAVIKRGERIIKKRLQEDGQYVVISGGVNPMGRTDKYNRNANTITISSYGTAGYVNFITEDFWANDVCMCVYPRSDGIDNKFLYYVLKSKQDYFYRNTTKAIPDHIPTDVIKDTVIPIPPLSVQRDIVTKLDAFSSYCTDLTSGLPAEIEARNKQYAYYRDMMLSFPMRKNK